MRTRLNNGVFEQRVAQHVVCFTIEISKFHIASCLMFTARRRCYTTSSRRCCRMRARSSTTGACSARSCDKRATFRSSLRRRCYWRSSCRYGKCVFHSAEVVAVDLENLTFVFRKSDFYVWVSVACTSFCACAPTACSGNATRLSTRSGRRGGV